MGSLGRRLLVFLLSSSLAFAPAFSAPKPLGIVLQAEAAKLGRDFVNNGTNVFPGSAVSTDAHGSLRLQLGTAQMYLSESSSALLEESDGRTAVYLNQGSVGFTAQKEESILIYAAGAWIRPQTLQPTHAEVTLTGPDEIIVTSRSGSVEIVVGDDVRVVEQNQTYRASLEPERHDLEGAGTKSGRKRRLAIYWLTGAGVAAIVTCAVLYNTGHNNNAASPVQVRDNGHCK